MLNIIVLFGVIGALPSIRSIPARQFLDSLGVNVHMEYTDGKYSDVATVLKNLNYLGITHVRDSVPQPGVWQPIGQGVAAIHKLADAGIKFDICVSNPDLAADLSELSALERHTPGTLSAVEGPNEINNWPISYQRFKGEAAAVRFQADLYKAIHRDPLFSGIPVYYFTGGRPATLKLHNRLADAANEHPYPQNGDQPGNSLSQAFTSDYPQSTVGKVITETGYYTLPSSRVWGGVDGITQAKGILSVFFEAVRQHIGATYLYQLLDAYPDPAKKTNDYHFGLFEYNNTPKPAALAIHNLTALLADNPSSPQRLSYRWDGLLPSARSLLLSKSDGTFIFAVWNSTPFWDKNKLEAIHSEPTNARLNLASAAAIERMDPLTNATETFSPNITFQIQIPDYPVLLIVKRKD